MLWRFVAGEGLVQIRGEPIDVMAWSMKARTRGARCLLAGQIRLAVAPPQS